MSFKTNSLFLRTFTKFKLTLDRFSINIQNFKMDKIYNPSDVPVPKIKGNETMVIFTKEDLKLYQDLCACFWVCDYCKRSKHNASEEVTFYPKDNRITFEQANDNETVGNKYHANTEYVYKCCNRCN